MSLLGVNGKCERERARVTVYLLGVSDGLVADRVLCVPVCGVGSCALCRIINHSVR